LVGFVARKTMLVRRLQTTSAGCAAVDSNASQNQSNLGKAAGGKIPHNAAEPNLSDRPAEPRKRNGDSHDDRNSDQAAGSAEAASGFLL